MEVDNKMDIILLEGNKFRFNGKEYDNVSLANIIKNGIFTSMAKENGGIIEIDTSELISVKKIENIGTLQQIFYGPPGTGKSYKVSEIIRKYYSNYNQNTGNIEFVFRTVIHPNFDYNDFIGSIMPVVKQSNDTSSISYEFKAGIFTNALTKAFNYPENDIFLVLEEMSRGNICEIFGDLFQILDRNKNGVSEFAINNEIINEHLNKTTNKQINNIYLPQNLHILGTVNTSDQNVYVMDTAFKRRFQMKYVDLKPIKDEQGRYLNDLEISINEINFKWIDLYQALNNYITGTLKLEDDKQLGQFFLKFRYIEDYDITELEEDNINKIDEYIKKWNKEQYVDKLMLYLWEDIHKVAMTSEDGLFRSDIKSFEDLLNKVNNNFQVFNEKFTENIER